MNMTTKIQDEQRQLDKRNEKPCYKLVEPAQELVVTRLAEFMGYEDIRKEILETYGVKITNEGVGYYLRAREKQILEKRRELDKHLAIIPCYNKVYRLKRVQRRLDNLGRLNDLDAKLQQRELDLLEQARKEQEGLKASVGIHRDDPFKEAPQGSGLPVSEINKLLETAKKAENKERKDEG